MPLDDHGLEVLRKSGELVTSGDKSNTYIKVSSIGTLLQGTQFDYVSISENSLDKVYTFKTGGSSGTTTGTVTLTYSDYIGGTLVSVTKS